MKKINIFKILLFTALFPLILASCEDVVEVELNEENIDLIAVEAYLNTKSTDNIYVKIERTLAVDETAVNPPINNAIVEISDNEATPNSVILAEDGNTGVYRLPENTAYETVAGRTYHLNITTPDGILITGSDYLQEIENLDTVKVNLSARGDYEFLAIFISSQETPNEGHYYKWDIYINNNMLYESENMAFASDELVDGNYIQDFEIFTDFYADEDEDEDRVLYEGDTIYVEQLSISEAAYDFYIGMMNQAFTGGPFSVPPANIPGNLTSSDGKRVLGIFSARDISPGSPIIIGEDNFTPLSQEISN